MFKLREVYATNTTSKREASQKKKNGIAGNIKSAKKGSSTIAGNIPSARKGSNSIAGNI